MGDKLRAQLERILTIYRGMLETVRAADDFSAYQLSITTDDDLKDDLELDGNDLARVGITNVILHIEDVLRMWDEKDNGDE